MKTKIDILFEDLWVNEYKRMKEQIFKGPKDSHGFGSIGEYKDRVFLVQEKEFEKLTEKAKKHGITISLTSESGAKDYLKIGAEYVKVAGKPLKLENQYLICDVRDCCLYDLNKDQHFLISTIYDFYLNKGKWPTARDIIVKIGSIKIKELFEDFPEAELLLYNQHTEMYQLTLFGILHLGRDESIFKAINYIMSKLKADLRNSRDKSKILYEDIYEASNLEGYLAKEITESLLQKLGSGGGITKKFYEVNIPNDEEKSSLILYYTNPISLCYSLFAKPTVYLTDVYSMAGSLPLSVNASSSIGDEMKEISKSVEQNAVIILEEIAEMSVKKAGKFVTGGDKLMKVTGLSPEEINDAVGILKASGLVEWFRRYKTSPFSFGYLMLTPRGKYEYERIVKEKTAPQEQGDKIIRPPVPVGSPFGFSNEDWKIVAEAKAKSELLIVVFGFQFESEYYDTPKLKSNIKKMFQLAVDKYNKIPGSLPAKLKFKALAAGYGEHLFNEIARDIISADIAVFDTSNLTANVMIEMGVALTWGVSVLPIKEKTCLKPPSDISGQTWAEYEGSGNLFIDDDHEEKLVQLVERAARKKGK